MIVIGKKNKVSFEKIISSFSYEIQQIYKNTDEVNSQKWLMIDLQDKDKRYIDVKTIIEIKYKK